MSKVFSELEQIFKYRLLSNADVPSYITRMSRMGKVDEVQKIALFGLILTKLAELEDKLEVSNMPVVELSAPFPLTLPNDAPTVPPIFSCPDCDMVAKSQLGLISHSRKHNKVV